MGAIGDRGRSPGRHAAAAFLFVGMTAAGCTAPQSMLVRTGDEPRYEDDDVAFRTTYYFRVFDVCEGIRPGFANASAGPSGTPVAYNQLFNEPKRPIKLQTDSLYRFRMTGKASTLGSQIQFESGTLRKDQIDPFGANVVFDKANSRFYFKSQEDTQADARKTEILAHIGRLQQLRNDLEGRAQKDAGARDQMAAVDQLILQDLNRLSPQGGATATATLPGVGPESAQKAEELRTAISQLVVRFADNGDIATEMAKIVSSTNEIQSRTLSVAIERSASFINLLKVILEAAKDEKIDAAFVAAAAAIKSADPNEGSADLKAAALAIKSRTDAKAARTAQVAGVQAYVGLVGAALPLPTDVSAVMVSVQALRLTASQDNEAIKTAMQRASAAVAANAAFKSAADKIGDAEKAVTPWQKAVSDIPSTDALVNVLRARADSTTATAVAAVKAKFEIAYKKDDGLLNVVDVAATDLAANSKNFVTYTAKARLEAIGTTPDGAKPSGFLTFTEAARAAPGLMTERSRKIGSSMSGAAAALDDLAQAARSAIVAVDGVRPLLPADGAASASASATTVRAALVAAERMSAESAQRLRVRAATAADVVVTESLPLPPKPAAAGNVPPICDDGSTARRGFQVLGPEGWRTFDQNERLIMAMSTSARPLIETLNEISGRILNTATNPTDALMPLMQERLRATEAKHRGDRTASSASATVALEGIIDAFRGPNDPASGGSTP